MLASSATSAWAVASNYDNGTADRTLILHWNGRHWQRSSSVPTPGPAATTSTRSGPRRPRTYTRIGNHSNGTVDKVLILHWDGRSARRVVPGQNPGTVINDLNAVFALSATSIWAVGSYNNGGFNQTLVEHCR